MAEPSFHVLGTAVFPVKSYNALEMAEPVEEEVSSRRSTRASFLEAQRSQETANQVVPTDTSAEKIKPKLLLTHFQSLLLSTAIEDTITQLRILVECNNEMRITKTIADMYFLLAQKYSIEQTVVEDELDTINVKKLYCLEYKLNKLDSDRKTVTKMMKALYMELALSREFTALSDLFNHMLQVEKYQQFLEEDEERNRVAYKEIAKNLRQQRNHQKTVEYDANGIIDKLRTQVEDASLWTEIQSRYINAYQMARGEQHVESIRDKESVSTEKIDYFKSRVEYEQRVHGEIELLTNIVINETLAKVEEWMEKYDKDMEKIDLKIQIMRNDYEKMLDRRSELEHTIEKHDNQMKNWINFKDERQRAKEYHDKMTKSAITVQAWWRGLLVRRQLGPFRPRKKPNKFKRK